MSSLRLIAVGIALFLLGILIIYWAKTLVPPCQYAFEVCETPDELVLLAFLALSFCGAGIWLFPRGVHPGLGGRVRKGSPPRIFPEIKLQNWMKWNMRSSSPSILAASLNAFSVSWICVLMTLVIIFMVLGPRPPHGLPIDWKQRRLTSNSENPWALTMGVYIKQPGLLCINDEPVKRTEFEARLREELSHRAEWTVYVEADADTAFMDTMYAIDTIQGLGGKVVWITPKTREEWKQQADKEKRAAQRLDSPLRNNRMRR